MDRPYINNIRESQDTTTVFSGYNHTSRCPEGAFYEMKNITAEEFPVMKVREDRAKGVYIDNPQGMIEKEKLVWVAGDTLYIDGEAVTLSKKLSTADSMCPKTIAKMGAIIVILPDNIWYNTEDKTSGAMGHEYSYTGSVTFTLVNGKGEAITWHDEDYYKNNEPKNGDYKMTTTDGKTALSVYSSSTKLWGTVTTTYYKITASGLNGFKSGDGVEVQVNLNGVSWDYAKTLFVNDDGNGLRSNNFVIREAGNGYITVVGLLDANKTLSLPIKIRRKVPEMAFVTECQNRLWGCSKDGHEIYCCKLGDVTNWNCFAGISTDSWAATIGTDGKFTGAYTYLGYPIFFKEDSLIRVTVSSTGAHQTKDLNCRGVQEGSERSLVMVNELLYYKSESGVCTYDGSFPQEISSALGGVRYRNAVGGTLGNRYYISMQGEDDMWNLFVYDAKSGIWVREDEVQVKWFAKHSNKLYFIGADNFLYCTEGGTKRVPWMVESGAIGYATAKKKQLSRLSLRMQMEVGSHASLFVEYDSSGVWKFVTNMSGKGTKSFTYPIRPCRCDHFRFRLVGEGACKIFGITKSYTEGSDI